MSIFGYSSTSVAKCVLRSVVALAGLLMSATVLANTSTNRVLWQHRFASAESETGGFIASLVPLRDGGFFLAGAIQLRPPGTSSDLNWHPWVLRIDAAGKVLWDRRLTFGVGDAVIAAAASLGGGGLVVVGHRSKVPPASGNDSWAARLGEDGEIIWQRVFPGRASNRFEVVMSLPGGRVLVGGGEGEAVYEGAREIVAGDSEAPRLVVLDPAGRLLRQQHLRDAHRVAIKGFLLEGDRQVALGVRWNTTCMPVLVSGETPGRSLLPEAVACPAEVSGGNNGGIAVAYRVEARSANSYPTDELGVRLLSRNKKTKWEWHGDPRPETGSGRLAIGTIRLQSNGIDRTVVALVVPSSASNPENREQAILLLRFDGTGRRLHSLRLDSPSLDGRASETVDAMAIMPGGRAAVAGQTFHHGDTAPSAYLDEVVWLMLVEWGEAAPRASMSPSK